MIMTTITDLLTRWINARRALVESESLPGTTYGDTEHDQTAVHYGQLEILDDIKTFVDDLAELEKLDRDRDQLKAFAGNRNN